MAVAETANLLVKMSLGGNFQQQIGKATGGLKNFDRQASRSYKAGQQIGTGIKRGALIAVAAVSSRSIKAAPSAADHFSSWPHSPYPRRNTSSSTARP